MASIYEEIIKRLDTLATDIAALTINEGAGAAGGSLSGSGTTNRITQWTGASSLGDSTLIKSGVGVVTLTSDTDYTVTIPGTGTLAYNPAISALDMNSLAVTGIDYLDFDLTPATSTTAEGRLRWNSTEGALEYGLAGGNVNVQIGKETLLPRRVKNDTVGDMVNGDLVYISGGDGTNAYIALAKADAEATSANTIAMLTEDIDAGAKGWAAVFGLVRGDAGQPIDTSAYAPGTVLYLSPTTAGKFTSTKTTAPNHLVKVGTVFRQHATEGSIIVDIDNGYELSELHDVAISSLATADLLRYNGTVWANSTPVAAGLAQGAGTLTVSTTNDATIAAHTHAITSSSNPGAAARLLASDANGYLRLTRIGLNKTPTSALDVVGQSVLNYSATSAAANAIGTTALLTKTADADDARTNATLTATTSLAGTFAYSGPNSAITASLYHDGSGLVSDAAGFYFIGGVRSTGNVTTFDIIRARASGAGSGTIGTLSGVRIYDVGASGTPTTMYGLRVDTSTGAVGTSKYGLYVFNISGAATNNYALFTNAGLVQFGDQLKIDGSADRIQEIVQAHSTQTTNLTEWQSSAAAVQAYVTGTGGAVFNEAGDAAGDVRIEGDTEANMFLSDASADTIYLGGTTNGIKIEKGGELTLIGTATRWDDLRVEPVVRGTGSKNPSFEVWLNGVYLYSFDDAAAGSEKEVWFSVQMPHSWKEGSAVEPHVHWTNKTAGTAGHVVRWGLEYTKAAIGGTFGATTTIYGTTIVGGGDITVANEHMLTDFASVDMTGDTLSTVIACRLFRNSSNAADTYTGTAGLLYIDWHYEIDALGSKTELSK